MILDGRKLRDILLQEVKQEVGKLSFQPLFSDIVIGDNPASLQYARMKKKTAESLGFTYVDAWFPEDIPLEKLKHEIALLVATPHMSGVIVQLPIPASLPQQEVLDCIPASIDVDVLSTQAAVSFYEKNQGLVLPTAKAVMYLLDEAQVDYTRDLFVVVGRGDLVGKPVAHILKTKGARVEVIASDTSEADKIELLAKADVIVSATGVAGLITGDMVQDGVVVIDAGTSEVSGTIVGDIDFDSVAPKAKYITPTPGGVGPVTVACLFKNILVAAQKL